MMALIVLGQNAAEYGFDVERANPVEYDRVWVPGGTTLRWIAGSVDVPLRAVRDLNPQLIRGVTPPGVLFPVRVPPGMSRMLVASQGKRWRTVAVDD
jgi:membrane-bound lytic murein transglycosylase D